MSQEEIDRPNENPLDFFRINKAPKIHGNHSNHVADQSLDLAKTISMPTFCTMRKNIMPFKQKFSIRHGELLSSISSSAEIWGLLKRIIWHRPSKRAYTAEDQSAVPWMPRISIPGGGGHVLARVWEVIDVVELVGLEEVDVRGKLRSRATVCIREF